MTMYFGFRFEHEQKLGLSLKHIHTEGDITIDSTCTNCKYPLTHEEIKAGWTNNPTDFSTLCPKCNNRFISKLIFNPYEDNEKPITVDFLCNIQLDHKIKNL